MPLILCSLRNASTKINGVEFKPTDAGMLSEEISAEQAEVFAAIPGYSVVQPQGKKGAKASGDAPPAGDTPPAGDAPPAN